YLTLVLALTYSPNTSYSLPIKRRASFLYSFVFVLALPLHLGHPDFLLNILSGVDSHSYPHTICFTLTFSLSFLYLLNTSYSVPLDSFNFSTNHSCVFVFFFILQ